jgi:hypothetical protein
MQESLSIEEKVFLLGIYTKKESETLRDLLAENCRKAPIFR